jgi:predicted membrane-bound spermidine synthase
MDSGAYLFLSSLVIGVAMLPWCFCMGATYPIMLAFIERADRDHARSFSRLYLANVIGALLGTLATSIVLIELYGFHKRVSRVGVSRAAAAP